jgi:hypothetical protein
VWRGSCAKEARRHGIDLVVLEAGAIVAEATGVVPFWMLRAGPVAEIIRAAIAAGKLRKVYGPSCAEVRHVAAALRG